MALFVHVTEACRLEAATHSFEPALDRFQERVEKSQDTRYFDPFPPPYLVKKQFGRFQGRLVAERHVVKHSEEDHTVIVFVSVLIRGERAYDAEFGKDPITYGERHFRNRFTQAELQALVADRLRKSPPPEKPKPSDQEYGYLYQVLGQQGGEADEMVCESPDWVKLMQEAPFKNWHASLYQALSADVVTDERGIGTLPVPGKSEWSILFRRFHDPKVLFLCAPLESQAAEKEIRARYAELLGPDRVEHEAILRRSKRAYPEIVLADGDLWLELQKEQQANLALSPEETAILETAREPKGAFPLFINGRAGSGKSTILQYLFTDYILRYLRERDLPHPPAYFTCNLELLNTARRMVETLIRCGGKYWAEADRARLLSDTAGTMDAAFREFHSHLRSLVPETERDAQFAPERHVGYATFRRLWQKKFAADPKAMKSYNPELCWHVVRTYIKGASVDALLDPEEYLQIEQKQRSVSQEAYELVFDKVWTRWYEALCRDEGYWDDQDLARYLIEKELLQPTYPAIFCDEAQDFTRLELEVILRMSIFSERKLVPSELARVPFVFAGDQFQTLNPTGFRWEAVKAWFAEKFIFALDPARLSDVELNYRELTFNYRSTPPIVSFSNFVQALRVALFDVSGVKPQTPWDDNPGSPVMSFRPDDAAFWEALSRFGDTVFVIPCAEGEEVQWISNDPILRQRISIADGVPSLPVLSAARAKGLEFNRVVVYGFGAHADTALLKPLKGGEPHSKHRDAALPLEYFINRLYVAISRPKRQLLLVDSDEGIEKLWCFANQPEFEDEILGRIKGGRETWGPAIVRPQAGRVDQMDTTTPVDMVANAEALTRDGRARQDSYMLRQAGIIYRNAAMEDAANRCHAEADELEGKFLGAGSTFMKIGDWESAIRCFWSEGEAGWPLILEAGRTRSEIVGRLEYIFADFLTGGKAAASGRRALQSLCQRISAGKHQEIRKAKRAWAKGVDFAVGSLLKQEAAASAGLTDWQQLDENLGVLVGAGLYERPLAEADVASRAGNFSKVVAIYERNGKTETDEYRRAKAESTAYPDRLTALGQLTQWDRIIAEWEEHQGMELAGANAAAVAVALSKRGRFEDATRLALASNQYATVSEVRKTADASKNTGLSRRLTPVEAVLAVAEEKWGAIAKMMGSVLDGTGPESVALVRALARSEPLTQLSGDAKSGSGSQASISAFLRKWYGSPRLDASPTPEEVGASIERAGNRIDALKYYEDLAKLSEGKTSRFAKERWIVCKERQAAHDETRGDLKSAQDRRREASEARTRLGTRSKALDSGYPKLSSLEVLAREIAQTPATVEPESTKPEPTAQGSSPQSIELVRPPFRFNYFPVAGRLNITREDTGETASIKDRGRVATGDWKLSKIRGDGAGTITAPDLPFTIECDDIRYAVNFKADGVVLSFGDAKPGS